MLWIKFHIYILRGVRVHTVSATIVLYWLTVVCNFAFCNIKSSVAVSGVGGDELFSLQLTWFVEFNSLLLLALQLLFNCLVLLVKVFARDCSIWAAMWSIHWWYDSGPAGASGNRRSSICFVLICSSCIAAVVEETSPLPLNFSINFCVSVKEKNSCCVIFDYIG